MNIEFMLRFGNLPHQVIVETYSYVHAGIHTLFSHYSELGVDNGAHNRNWRQIKALIQRFIYIVLQTVRTYLRHTIIP